MKVSNLLKKTGINPNKPVLLITAEEAMEALLEAIEEYCPTFKIGKMKKGDIEILLDNYGSCVINYHPENNHQERAALLKSFEILKHYGLPDDDYNSLDFY